MNWDRVNRERRLRNQPPPPDDESEATEPRPEPRTGTRRCCICGRAIRDGEPVKPVDTSSKVGMAHTYCLGTMIRGTG